MEKVSSKEPLKSSIIRSFVNFTILSFILIFVLLSFSIVTLQIFQFAIPYPIDNFFTYLRLLSLLIGVILIAISFYYWRLNQPLKCLSKAVEKMENGQLNFQLKHTFKGELGQVCNAFESMIEALSKKHTFIERPLPAREKTKQKISPLKSVIVSFALYLAVGIFLIVIVSGIMVTIISNQGIDHAVLNTFFLL